MSIDYKEPHIFQNAADRYNEAQHQANSKDNYNNFFNVSNDTDNNYSDLNEINSFIDFCDKFLESWFSCQYSDLDIHIEYLKVRAIVMANDEISQIAINREIPLTLLEIISVTDDDYPDNLSDYIDSGQDIIQKAMLTLCSMSHYSQEIANYLIDFDILKIIIENFDEYSEIVKDASLDFITTIIYIEKAVYKLDCNYLNIFFDIIKTTQLISKVEKISSIVETIARSTKNPLISDMKPKLIEIICFLLNNVQNSIFLNTISSVFYMAFYDERFLEFQTIEQAISLSFANSSPEVMFFCIQILKLCYLYFPDDRLMNIHSNINFNFLNDLLEVNEPLTFCVSQLLIVVAKRGGRYLNSIFDVFLFTHLFNVFQETTFEIKNSVLYVFLYSFINSEINQLKELCSYNYDLFLFESMSNLDSFDLALNALYVIATNFPERIKKQEIIENLNRIETENDEEKKLIEHLLSIATSDSEI